jgi:hypothetical protein
MASFLRQGLTNFFPGITSNYVPLTFISCVAGITEMCHHAWPLLPILMRKIRPLILTCQYDPTETRLITPFNKNGQGNKKEAISRTPYPTFHSWCFSRWAHNLGITSHWMDGTAHQVKNRIWFSQIVNWCLTKIPRIVFSTNGTWTIVYPLQISGLTPYTR